MAKPFVRATEAEAAGGLKQFSSNQFVMIEAFIMKLPAVAIFAIASHKFASLISTFVPAHQPKSGMGSYDQKCCVA